MLELREVPGDLRLKGVADQAWRASCSIGANIAEGSGFTSRKQFARYLALAIGSAQELDNHLQLLIDGGHISKQAGGARLSAVQEVRRMLWALHKRALRDAT